MKLKKNILLVLELIKYLKLKKFKKADFIFEKITNKFNSCDGVVGITESLEEFLKELF